MKVICPAIYRDCAGSEAITFNSNGSQLQTIIRGVEFQGESFDSLTAQQSMDCFRLTANGDLYACQLDIVIPSRLLAPEGLRIVDLLVEIQLGQLNSTEEVKQLTTGLSVQQPEFQLKLCSDAGYFETVFLDLIKQLPADFKFENCLTCGLSDYHPFGSGFFGGMACFRHYKQAYRTVKDKADLFDLWWGDVNPVATQETYYCSEYENRPMPHGYRG